MTHNASPNGTFAQRYLSPPSPGQQLQYSGRTSIPQEQDVSMSYSRTPECQKILDRISTFCGQENLVQRVAFLDQELSVFGYPSVLSDVHYSHHGAQTQPHGSIDLVTLVNISYDLLQSWRQTIDSHSNATDLQRSTESEVVRLQHLISRLKEDIAGKDREIKSKELMQLQITQRLESLKKKLKQEQEKCKRMGGELSTRDSQFRHEKKKKIQEVEKLQARLQQLLQDKRQERMLGIEILNSLQRSDGKRGKWATDKTKKSNEQDMYRLIITNYEDAQKQLLKENEGMRKYLKEMQGELISALNERNTVGGQQDQNDETRHNKVEGHGQGDKTSSRSSSAASNVSDVSEASEPMSEGMFEMPYDMVKEDIERSIRTKWKALKKEIRKTRASETSKQSNRESITQSEYDDLVQQQQELIDYLTSSQNNTERAIPEDSYFLEEKAELEKQRNIFMQQKLNFEKERKLYAEALIQLDEQRQNFEAEKNKWLQQNFLQMTPFRENRGATQSGTPLHIVRGNEMSARNNRPQPYKPRPSSSPERSAMKSSDQTGSYKNGPNYDPSSPISHTLSRLHSSSHQNSFSPGSNTLRSPEASAAWQTPENQRKVQVVGHKNKATTATSGGLLPPTTAELYRSLGLVYYGNDKENLETGNSTVRRARSSVNTNSNNHHGYMIKPKLTTNHVRSRFKGQFLQTSSPEFVSASGSMESVKSNLDDYYDADPRGDNPLKYRTKSEPAVREDKGEVYADAMDIENVMNDFQMTKVISRSRKGGRDPRKIFASKSLDEKNLRQIKPGDIERGVVEVDPKCKSKKYGIKNFVKSLVGTQSKKRGNLNESQLLSNSDSQLSLRYADAQSGARGFPYPSSGTLHVDGPNHPTKAAGQRVRLGSADGNVFHSRTRSLPEKEEKEEPKGSKRKSSYDGPALTQSAERHKSALMSISANYQPNIELKSCKSESHSSMLATARAKHSLLSLQDQGQSSKFNRFGSGGSRKSYFKQAFASAYNSEKALLDHNGNIRKSPRYVASGRNQFEPDQTSHEELSANQNGASLIEQLALADQSLGSMRIDDGEQ